MVHLNALSIWNIETSEWVIRVFLIRARMGRRAGEGAGVGGGRPRACLLNLHANSTRLLGNISCLVYSYTNNVRCGYKLRKGNTNVARTQPKLKSNISPIGRITTVAWISELEVAARTRATETIFWKTSKIHSF